MISIHVKVSDHNITYLIKQTVLSSDCYNREFILTVLYQILMSVRLTMVDVMRPVLTVMVATHVSVTVTYDCYLISGLVDVSEMKIKLFLILVGI